MHRDQIKVGSWYASRDLTRPRKVVAIRGDLVVYAVGGLRSVEQTLTIDEFAAWATRRFAGSLPNPERPDKPKPLSYQFHGSDDDP